MPTFSSFGGLSAIGRGARSLSYRSGFLTKFTYTSNASLLIPEDVQFVRIKCWGAGGGYSSGYAVNGGGGGFAKGDVLVAPGSTLVIRVGSAGVSDYWGSYGGGLVGVFESSVSQSNALVVAGSGGGGAYAWSTNPAGAGGGTSGQAGGSGGGGGGAGGTQTTGYAQVSDGAYTHAYAGGGGGGYWSGIPGQAVAGSYYGSGGGGSGYVRSDASNSQNTAGSGANVAGSSDADYIGGYGNHTQQGLVVVYY